MKRAGWKVGAVLLAVVLIALSLRDTSAPVAASAEGDIAAPLAVVWGLKTDMAHWQEWNRDINRCRSMARCDPAHVSSGRRVG